MTFAAALPRETTGRSAYDVLLKLYGPTWVYTNVTEGEMDGHPGCLCRISTGKIGRMVQLERLKSNGLRSQIFGKDRVFVTLEAAQ